MDTTQNRRSSLVIARSNRPILLELLKEVLDEMPPGVHMRVIVSCFYAIGFRRNNSFYPRLFEDIQYTVFSIIGFVC